MRGEREKLIHYLLGRLPEEEREAVAERLFSDTGFADELEAAERDLLDAYALGTASSQDRAAIEACLLQSEAQREKLRFSRTLARARAPRSKRSMLAIGIAAALILSLGGLGSARLFFSKREPAGATARPRTSAMRESLAKPAITAFLLSAGALRGAATVLPIQPGNGPVRLDLEVEDESASPSYDLRLATGGRRLLEQREVRSRREAGTTLVSVWLGSSVLQPGDYTLTLSAHGATRQASTYYFHCN